MRPSAATPRRSLPRNRLWIIGAAIVVLVVILSLRAVAGFYIDYLWFQSLSLTGVWSGILGAKVGLALSFSLILAVFLWVSLFIADRFTPRFRLLGPDDELVQRYRDTLGKHVGAVRTVTAVVFGLLVGTSASGQWNNWILFRNSVSFGVKDPQFHRDVSFYVFRLPFLSFLVSWFFVAIVVVAVVTAINYYLNGGIRPQGPGQRVSPQVKAHISVLLGILALVKAVGYYLQRFHLTTSTQGFAEGAFYTDVKAQLPALTLLIFISLVSFVLFVVNIRRRGWVLPLIGVGLWAFLSVVLGAIYPALIQKFKVQPSQISLEKPYIARNIEATRAAMGLDKIKTTNFAYAENLNPTQLAGHAPSLNDVRLWDPTYAAVTYDKLQDIRSYYHFQELGLGRYMINNKLTPTIMAVRQLNSADLPSKSWVNLHLQYTHGYGAVLAGANQATPDGNPQFLIQDVPPVSQAGVPLINQPSVYFGLGINGYVIANSRQPEIDYQRPDGSSKYSTYSGSGGVALGSVARRAAFALKFGDINPLISNQVTSTSRVMFVRDIQQRVAKAAPFLHFDADPYPILLKGKIYWLQDAYTTTSAYPYAQAANTSAVNPTSGLNSSFNYVRNSVKILINAYTGSMTFYQVDSHDPIIRAYAKAFPKLFTPGSQMPSDLRAHLRYPQDIFTVQAAAFGRYHITDPTNFYNAGDAWDLSQDPGSGSPSAVLRTTQTTNAQGVPVGNARQARMAPIYQLLKLPGDSKVSFNILEPYVPVSQNDQQQNLSAFLVARSDPNNYGQMEVFVTPRGVQVDGPALINARINAVPSVSQQISLLNQQGSQVKYGNVLMVPIDQSLLYIRPLYIESSQNPLAEFKKVIVVYGTQVAIDDTLGQALSSVFGAPIPGVANGTTPPSNPINPLLPINPSTGPPTVSGSVANLVAQTEADYAKAQADLKAGDFAAYGQDIKAVGADLAQLKAATTPGKGSTPSPTTTSTPPSSTTTTKPGA
ncbi:MAG: UPF0182 family protein [Acidimicrobiales bacterium]